MASSISTAWKYDVFLNFRGSDTRDGFISYLYRSLRLMGINVCIDENLEKGEDISTAILREIESSRISVVVFSQNYAFSTYCLDELVKIIECIESKGQIILPIFYKVDPEDVEQQRGSYEKAFVYHEAKLKEEKDRDKWKLALSKAVTFSGWHLDSNKEDSKYIEEIVKTVLKKLNDGKRETLKRKLLELQSIEADIISQSGNAESTSSKRQKTAVVNWLKSAGRIIKDAQNVHQVLEESTWTMQLGSHVDKMIEEVNQLIDGKVELDAVETNVDALPTKRLVGQEFQSNMDLILEWLLMDKVSSIGICGMGGVGKTTLLTHVHNKLLENPRSFPRVYWVTVSQDFSVYKLQSLVAKTMKINLDAEECVRKRAARLSRELSRGKKFVLIVDDLWNYFDVIEVGIPIEKSRCKLIITTRSMEICRRTNCQELVKVIPLNKEEAWELFVKTFGYELPSDIEMIAKSIARECSGLPLGIVSMAGSMRGVDSIHEWKNALAELRKSTVRQDDMEKEVFRILRYSYNRLNDSALQQCLLYCALFPEDKKISREELVELLIVEGIVDKEKDTRSEKRAKAYTMLNKLEYAFLLQGYSYSVKMHDLIRDMAVQIIKECHPSLVEPGKQLKQVPDEKYWRKDLETVSLINNDIVEIPSNFSPSCPNVSTLLLSGNSRLESIPDSFFCEMQGVKVLDIRFTKIEELPESIDLLENLTALFLSFFSLRYVPILPSHTSMELLDLEHCSNIEEVPIGLEMMSNLRYLNLRWSGIEEFPTGILPKLCHLEFLVFNKPSANAEELGGLRRLETLYWRFPTIEDLIIYLDLISKMPTKQIRYSLGIGPSEFQNMFPLEEKIGHHVSLNDYTITREDMHSLSLYDISLDHGSGMELENSVGWKALDILDCRCRRIKFLSTSSAFFQSIEELEVCGLKKLSILLSDSKTKVPRPLDSTPSLCLRKLLVYACGMKRLV